MLSVRGLTKQFGDQILFKDVNFVLSGTKKIGLVGKNGCGKSTLLKILTGCEEPTGGNIQIQGEILGYIPQEFSFPNMMVGEYLESVLPNKEELYKVDMLVSQLKFHNYDEYQELNTLSEGQKMKVKLIETLLNEPTILFIDEPTNHLDIEGIMWFEEYVNSLDLTVIMISHDRSFLNHTVDEIWEIDKSNLYRFVGDYDNYKMEKLKLIDKWNSEYVLFLKKKTQLETLLESVKKIKDGKKRGKAVSSVKHRIEREITSNEKEQYISKRINDIQFDTAIHNSKLMLRFEDVSKNYGEKNVFEHLNFDIRGKEKVWLFGPNGAGKSTIVKMIMGIEDVTAGNIRLGDNIKVGYFSQTQTHLDTDKNLADAFYDETRCYYYDIPGYLRRFLFEKDALKKKIKNLSPGERARFAFSIFAYKDYDMLILDEPDNHLDIETKEVLENSLNEFKGTLLLVSHDRYFVERVGIDKLLNLTESSFSFYQTEEV